ncbi:BlaI/MecI/CopY family transcriptional regulator [Aestuariicella hydrocarbonica]|uniref:BlaI/MecI/CopY family transcriptional regulator n=1 Tax=Pseudomaricurvus hydrocarbonicus TaxID=1470433 RepID=A0A9E5MLP7_9GAMM|nr:BlaI/MecI/CopY family transcriptional regulator [Aestuariicella hydrocarbonica]NHO64340.1 BlaI/MecI/CopY family transcriptional regulator [Aestuariicella hydrocarbonica]
MPADVSKAELTVLKVLWKQQPLSVREVHDHLHTNWAYTTTKTVMDRMTGKGLLARSNQHGVNIYVPLVSRAEGMVQWVRFFADQVLDMGYDEVLNLFDRKQQYSQEELDELAALLKDQDNDKKTLT